MQVEPQANQFNAKEEFNHGLFRKLGDLGLLGLTVDDEYGGVGSGFAAPTEEKQQQQDSGSNKDDNDGDATTTSATSGRATAVVIAHEELASSDPALCLSYLAHSLLLVNNLHANASHEQKLKFLPALVSGQLIGGMGMSEPGAGTDVLGMKTSAAYDASRDAWILTGSKMWITNGCLTDPTQPGDVFLVYARTGPQRTDLTSFVVERSMDGFAVGQKVTGKLGMRASPTAELVFDQVKIPAATHVIGSAHGATICMMRNLEIERLGLAAMGLGIARRCLNEMKSYALQRRAFGTDLYKFGQVQRLIAESYARYVAGRSYVYAVASNLDLNRPGNGLDADGTKLFCAKMAKDVADNAIQVLGGNGYTEEYKVERLWRDAKLLEIGGGTNESHHKNMVRDLRKMGSTPIE
jgi:isovaleryl-CoA dehydrogenase